jgi:hypothetical protein
VTDLKTITQGHPTYHEPDDNKGGQDGAPKPDGRSRRDTASRPPAKDADTIATADDPARGVG